MGPDIDRGDTTRSRPQRDRRSWCGTAVRYQAAGGGRYDRAVGELTIGGRRIGDDAGCYVIAEIGHNHQGSLEKAQGALPRAPRTAGVDAVKLQKRDNRALFTRADVRQALRQREQLRRRPMASTARRWSSAATSTSSSRRYAAELGSTSSPPRSTSRAPTSSRARHAGVQDRLGRPEEHAAAASRRAFGKPMVSRPAARRSRTSTAPTTTVMPINPQVCLLQCTAAIPRRSRSWTSASSRRSASGSRTSSSASPTTRTASPWRSRPTCSARASSRSTSRSTTP